jgi:L-ascorbate metabolism protein UlaG (beta-lactamase superfamily)
VHHFDNLDNAGRALLPKAGATYTTNSGAERLGGNALGFAPFETQERPAAVRHGDARAARTDRGRRWRRHWLCPRREEPGDLIYITGDTLWFDGTAEVSRRFSPKVVMLFTGAAEPRGRFHMTMGSEDALEAAAAFPDAALLSVHNEGWGHLKENQDQLAEVFVKFNLADRLARFDRGEPLSFTV